MLSTTRPSGPARLGALLLPAVLAATIAACSSAAGAPPSSPGESPAPTPMATPSPVSTPTPEPTATPVPSTPVDNVVDLDTADVHEVSVAVDNATGYPVRVTSGRAGDGMSVRWGDVEVVNVDDSTLRVTWVGLPFDEQINLKISIDNGPILLTFEQKAPPANSDATGFDRVIILGFDTPVSADEVIAQFSQAV